MEEVNAQVMDRKQLRGRKGQLVLAESVDMVTHQRAIANQPTSGDTTAWDNFLWITDEETRTTPLTPVGTSRGTCVNLGKGEDAAGHCSFTLTITTEDKNGIALNKIMVMGAVETLAWSEIPQTLAVVGGTGEFEAVAGVVDVTYDTDMNFFFYNISFD